MSFQRKLLAVFVVTVFLCIGAVTAIVSMMTRRVFEQSDREQTTALVAQFRQEFDRRGEEVARHVEAIAASEASMRMALELGHGTPDYGSYLPEAKNIAESQQLDFLEFVDSQGTVISSAQSPARFGYKENISLVNAPPRAFLREEDLPEGSALGLFALQKTGNGDKPLYVIGGRRLDKNFLASLELPAGMRALLYENLAPGFSPQLLIDSKGSVPAPQQLSLLIEEVQKKHHETEAVIHWSSNPAEDEMVHAIPLNGPDDRLLGILLVGSSRRAYVELRRHIRAAALLAGAAGIVLAIGFSSWASARVTRPVVQLAEAAKEVAAGDWNARVPVTSSDELGALAESFNHMTTELLGQRERLVQAERVAAWRELARRLAHELKNPLFPLQLTVENLVRARAQEPEQFDEVFRESTATLLAEIANLKQIVSRFSEFSRMPQPQFQRINLNEIVQNVLRLFQSQFKDHGRVECKLDLAKDMTPIAADPDLLHQTISNLVKNAMEAMPDGGVLDLRTLQNGDRTVLEVSDTGVGLTSQECAQLFTPYYTSKPRGTGLGLAIAQSVVTDHGGSISVHSESGRGTTFRIELPSHLEKLALDAVPRASSQSTS